ncbi:MAG: hypothetical protein MI757_20165 [Pirellulales bacterium]|nr:hypothetical protein [Pirellulales bacterium]
MSPAQLEKRIAALEQEMARLKSRLDAGDERPWWERIAGTFANDPAHEEARKLGQEYRRAQKYDDSADE